MVGFGFSFAMEQRALNSGVLMKWTKGFDVAGVVGRDVVPMLSGGFSPPPPKRRNCGSCADALKRAGCPSPPAPFPPKP